ncbi:methyl-accepting chemotaxis protein [Labilibacter sediminis]|nr:methyl-accepting chemotaxis protein [Labilibacter sediminis]
MKKISLKVKLNIYILSAFFMVFGITMIIIITSAREKSNEHAMSVADLKGKEVASNVKNYFDYATQSSKTLVQSIMALKKENHTSRELVIEMMEQVLKENDSYYAVWTMWELNGFDAKDHEYAKQYNLELGLFNGSVFREGNKIAKQNYGDEESPNYVSYDDEEYGETYYTGSKNTKQIYIDDPSEYSFTGKEEDMVSSTSVVAPVLKDNQFLGVIGIDIDFETLMQLNAQTNVYESGFSAIITNNHIISAHPNEAYQGNSIDTILSDYNKELEKAINKGESYSYQTVSEYTNKEVLRIFSPVAIGNPDMPWSVMIEIPMEEIMAEARTTTKIILTIGLISILIMFGIVLLISRNITRPIISIVDVMQEIAKGNIGVDIQQSNREDEIGILENSLKNMVQKLTEVVKSIIEGASNISAASEQFTGVAEQISQGANEQAASVEEVSSTTEEIAANIEQNTDNAQQTEKISSLAQKGIQEVTEQAVKTLDATRIISDKIQVINDIAFQTNILALNAAVEAARAGEHGRGFAVVASEVRKLAENSRAAADQIITMAQDTLGLAENTGNQLTEMLPEIEKTTHLVQEISSASQEQSSATNQVNSAIQELNNITQENSSAAEELASSAEELASQAVGLKDMVSFFRIG